jgi:type VI secretion system protein ImpC
VFTSDDGDMDAKCPTEIAITDRREFELSNLGFLPLCHYKNTDYSVFFGAQTAQKPKKYDRPGRPRMPRSLLACRISWRPAGSRTT